MQTYVWDSMNGYWKLVTVPEGYEFPILTREDLPENAPLEPVTP